MMIVTAVLGIGFIFALAGDFVLWAKLDEQRKATAEEYNRRWDEISRAASLEQELEKEKSLGAEREEEIFRLSVWHNIMQDKLSSVLCPTNNHVWRDGECVKCGRMQ